MDELTKVFKERREEARAQGLKTYEGKPCIHGHGTERSVASNDCPICGRQRTLKRDSANREAKRQYANQYNKQNKENSNGFKIEVAFKKYLEDSQGKTVNLDGFLENLNGSQNLDGCLNFYGLSLQKQNTVLRRIAAHNGEMEYTGVLPCKQCGGVLRNTKSNACVPCSKKRRKEDYKANREYYIKKASEYQTRRRKEDPLFNFKVSARNLINVSLRRQAVMKDKTTEEILGCTFEEFKEHIEKQFKPGMSFENRKKWHIDHKIPLATAQSEEEVLGLCHYTNLQPLWAAENWEKGSTVE